MPRIATVGSLVLGILLAAALAGGVAQAGPSRARVSDRAFVLRAGGVRRIRVGRSFAYLRARQLVGPLRPGCELAGTGNDFSATLRGHLHGVVEFNRRRRAVNVSVTRGAVTSRGVGIGARLARVKRAYPRARYRLDPVFRVFFVHIGPRAGGFTVTVGGSSRRVESLSAHYPPVCE